MRRIVFVSILFLCMLFFLTQQVLNPIWFFVLSETSVPQRFNSTGRYSRYLKVTAQDGLREDYIDDTIRSVKAHIGREEDNRNDEDVKVLRKQNEPKEEDIDDTVERIKPHKGRAEDDKKGEDRKDLRKHGELKDDYNFMFDRIPRKKVHKLWDDDVKDNRDENVRVQMKQEDIEDDNRDNDDEENKAQIEFKDNEIRDRPKQAGKEKRREGRNNNNGGDDDQKSEDVRLRKSPYIVNQADEEKLMAIQPEMSEVKLISYWTPTRRRHSFESCRYNKCEWVDDNRKADAVLFRAASVRGQLIKPFRRKPGQRWILYTADSAAKMFRLDGVDVANVFNGTSTYQLHSDYPRPFGRLQRTQLPMKDYEKIFDGKTKQVAWFVSHCNTWSKRELYIARMRKIIPVDVFGDCGNLTCGGGVNRKRSEDVDVCLPMLSKQYKFYLSFENSFCQDYVTEKFFKLFQGIDVIPVVQGAFDYKKHLPSNIFVDSSDFNTPEALSRYLLQLSKDKNRYVQMLEKKSRWTFRPVQGLHCAICEGLHTDNRSQHFYADAYAAFNGRPSECYPPRWLEQ